jgi:hypothetical protein
MPDTIDFEDVRADLRPRDVFTHPAHDWKRQGRTKWKGGCPWHTSDSGTAFQIDPETLEWWCHACEKGGGPLEYVAELEGIGGGARGLKGKDFLRAWEALANHAGCDGPPDRSAGGESRGKRTRSGTRPGAGRQPRQETAASKAGGRWDVQVSSDGSGPELDTPEADLRALLSRYRKALKTSGRARRYVESRGLSVGVLYRAGCGFAPRGEWDGPGRGPRLVTPHVRPSEDGRPRLVNLSGRFAGDCPKSERHRHFAGNPTAPFNTQAIKGGTGPLVVCEGPLDALSFAEAGHGRALALHGAEPTEGLWAALSGAVDTLAVAFDNDDTGRAKTRQVARDAFLWGLTVHTVSGECYPEHGDPNDALQAGALSVEYLRQIGDGDGSAAVDGSEAVPAAKQSGREKKSSTEGGADVPAGGSEWPVTERMDAHASGHERAAPADLVPYWNGSDIGHLGRWLWERDTAPIGPAGGGVHADWHLHRWIVAELERGPERAENPERLRRVLWRLYAAFGPEDIPEPAVRYLAGDGGPDGPEGGEAGASATPTTAAT